MAAWMPAQSAAHFGLVVYALLKLQQGQNAMDGGMDAAGIWQGRFAALV
jgi:hypothetical protein